MSYNGDHTIYQYSISVKYGGQVLIVLSEKKQYALLKIQDMNCMMGVVKFTDRCTLVPELTLSV